MTSKYAAFALAACLLALVPAARADGSDATITVIEDGDTPDDIAKVIELPARAAPPASARSGNASDTSAQAKDKGESGRDFGQQTANEARSRNASEQAQEARDRARNDARNDNAAANRHGPPN